ncbi:MAG: PEP-CTERM sorting domain-containing protein [Spartobacteria bacterium]|nr:PEP-CTERM sorting domain-containing protein [Spartobacteria bacterium]
MGSVIKKKYLACFVLTALQAAAIGVYSDVIYDVDFENPPHTLGSAPVTGSGSDRPTDHNGFGWTISSGVADLSSQVAVVDDTGFEFMSFFPGPTFDSQILTLSWDFAVLSTDNSESLLQGSMTVNSPTGPGTLINVSYLFDGTVRVFDQVTGDQGVSTWTLGQSAEYSLLIDLDSDSYDFLVDGSPLLVDNPLDPSEDLDRVNFYRPFGSPSYAIDNFQWQIIPEPSTIALMLLALGGLAVGRCRR